MANRYEALLSDRTSKSGTKPSLQTLHRGYSEEANEVLSRMDIKNMGQRLINASQKKRKAKKGDKKKLSD